MRLIAVVSQNSGVGKTTLAANLGHMLTLQGKRVTLVDFDPRGHLGARLGLFRAPGRGLDRFLLNGTDLASLSLETRDGMMLIPPGVRLGSIEQFCSSRLARSRLLQARLERTPPAGDFVLFDCPTECELLTANVLMVTDETLIPVTEDCLASGAPQRLLETLYRFERLRGRSMRHRLLVSRAGARRRRAAAMLKKIVDCRTGSRVGGSIPQTEVLAECGEIGRTVFEYRPKSRSAQAFTRLAEELLAVVR